jgi:hypothetical protein
MKEDLLVSGWSLELNQETLFAGVARCLDRLQRDFLWEGLGFEPKLHLVNLKIIYSPVPIGVLGIKNLNVF